MRFSKEKRARHNKQEWQQIKFVSAIYVAASIGFDKDVLPCFSLNRSTWNDVRLWRVVMNRKYKHTERRLKRLERQGKGKGKARKSISKSRHRRLQAVGWSHSCCVGTVSSSSARSRKSVLPFFDELYRLQGQVTNRDSSIQLRVATRVPNRTADLGGRAQER